MLVTKFVITREMQLENKIKISKSTQRIINLLSNKVRAANSFSELKNYKFLTPEGPNLSLVRSSNFTAAKISASVAVCAILPSV